MADTESGGDVNSRGLTIQPERRRCVDVETALMLDSYRVSDDQQTIEDLLARL